MTSVLIFALLLAQSAAPPDKCTLSGTAVDSATGLPLGKVNVVAEHKSGPDVDASTTTDVKGHFVMVDVDPGQYRIAARRNGYLDTYYGAKRPSEPGSTITLAAGQKVDGLRITLTPFGVVAGTVRDTDGEPLQGAWISVYRFLNSQRENGNRVQLVANTTTDDQGQYRVADLRPGRYYVCAEWNSFGRGRPPAVDHSVTPADAPEFRVRTYYPGTADPADSAQVEVSAGTRATGIDITIVRSRLYKVSAHVESPPGLKTSARLMYPLAGFGDIGTLGNADSRGDLKISGIPAGSYELQVLLDEPDQPDDAVDNPARLRIFCAVAYRLPSTITTSKACALRPAAARWYEGISRWKAPMRPLWAAVSWTSIRDSATLPSELMALLQPVSIQERAT